MNSREHSEENSDFLPKTALGKKLWEKRKRIIESGAKLLTYEEIREEVARRRGYIASDTSQDSGS